MFCKFKNLRAKFEHFKKTRQSELPISGNKGRNAWEKN